MKSEQEWIQEAIASLETWGDESELFASNTLVVGSDYALVCYGSRECVKEIRESEING